MIRKPALVPSDTGYVASTPSSRETGNWANPKKPKTPQTAIIAAGIFGYLVTWKLNILDISKMVRNYINLEKKNTDVLKGFGYNYRPR